MMHLLTVLSHALHRRGPGCNRCGKTPGHYRHNCPAKDAVCHKCSKKGHYGAVCRSSSKTVGMVEEEDYAFLGEIETATSENPWCVNLTLNKSHVYFKIDTGADVTVIPERIFKTLRPPPRLEKSNKTLYGPAHTTLPV